MAQDPKRGANGRDSDFDTIRDAKQPAWPKLPGIRQHNPGWNTSLGTTEDISAKVERDAKTYRR